MDQTESARLSPQELKERIEHRDALLDIQAVLATRSGKAFITYLFKSLDVGELPEQGLEGSILMENLGFLRAGNEVFKLVAEANAEVAGEIFGKIKKEHNEQIYSET